MITQFLSSTPNGRLRLRLALLIVAPSLAMVACQKVPLLAPSGSTITLTSSATVLPVNGTTTLIAQVLEPSGTPPQNGTHVTFTTTLGTIQPAEADTDTSGRVVVTYVAGAASGTATITAISGGANLGSAGAVRILIGTASVGRVSVAATPALIPATGGSSTIVASVFDINGNPLPSALVSFTTTSGTLSSSVATTDGTGNARSVLTTFSAATVTASVGAQGSTGGGTTTPPATGSPTPTPAPASSGTASGSVTVGIQNAPTLSITPPSTAPNGGLPASFTFAVTPAANGGSAVKDVTVNWGDGKIQDLQVITGSQVVSHVYVTDNTGSQTFFITATLTDTAGNVVPASTSVTVVPTPLPTINVTPTVTGTSRNVSFQIQVTTPAGVNIQQASINFGDGHTDQLGGLSGTLTKTHNYDPGTGTSFTVTVSVVDSLGRPSSGSTSVTISP